MFDVHKITCVTATCEAPESGDPMDTEGGDPLNPEGDEPMSPDGGDPMDTEGGDPTNPEGDEPMSPDGSEPMDPEGGDPVTTYIQGEVLTFACAYGMQWESGDMTRTCMDTGEFSGEQLICTSKALSN